MYKYTHMFYSGDTSARMRCIFRSSPQLNLSLTVLLQPPAPHAPGNKHLSPTTIQRTNISLTLSRENRWMHLRQSPKTPRVRLGKRRLSQLAGLELLGVMRTRVASSSRKKVLKFMFAPYFFINMCCSSCQVYYVSTFIVVSCRNVSNSTRPL